VQKRFVVITPSGVVEKNVTLSDRIQRLKVSIEMLRNIIVSEIKGRIFGKTLGLMLLTIQPVILALMYYVLTVLIFKSGGATEGFVAIFTAVVTYQWFSKTVDSSPTAISSYGAVLKQTNFPVYLVVVIHVGIECVMAFFSFSVLVIFLSLFGYYPNIYYFFLPFVLFVQLMLIFAVVFYMAVLGAFFKDLINILYAFTSFLWYMSPGIYSMSMVPPNLLWLYKMNPFVYILPSYQKIMIHGQMPNLLPLIIILIISFILFIGGYRLLRAMQNKFYMYI